MRIAQNILIENEIKIGEFYDMTGQPNGVTYSYKEYKVVDETNYVLEVGRYIEDSITVEEICSRTGIILGVSAWIINE